MVDISALIPHIWFILLLSLIGALLVFPLVVIGSFLYDYLVKRHEKTPKILIMLVVTFVIVVIVVTLLEAYFGYTLPQVFSSPQ
ncbi:MAG: hypothetical protein Q8R15_04430 [Candidatus Micrarchaeota archaeon]|nr:hypothetical protein [Candidatus Micrarchaeota archaeon]